MANQCCGAELKAEEFSKSFGRVLWVVIAINGSMFAVEMTSGIFGKSQALKADALDFLGDTATYGITLMVLGMPLLWRARAALFKGVTLGVLGLWILVSTFYGVLVLNEPQAEIMAPVGFLALLANMTSVLLLMKYRNGDSNVRSVWLCSRNDAIGNLAVILAAGGIWATETAWPDLIVAGVLAGLFVWSSVQIIRQALHEMARTRIPSLS